MKQENRKTTRDLFTVSAALLVFVFVLGSPSAAASEQHFVTCFASTEINYNPLHSFTATEAQIYTALYEGLVTYHPYTMNPVPAVAEDWEISEDKKTYTFHLRNDARYWSGEAVTAEHFRDAWFKLIDPDEHAEYSFLFDIIKGVEPYRKGELTDKEKVGIRVVSPDVLEVELDHPAGHFLKILCHHSFVPIHPKHLEADNWKTYSSIVGNGPYYILERNPDKIVLERNEWYWDAGNVDIRSMEIVFIDNQQEVMKKFNKKEIHWVADGMIIDEVEDKGSIIPNALFSTNYFYFYTGEQPWNNPQVRKALATMLPWSEIRDERYMFIPADTLVPPISAYPESEGITEQDLEAGKAMLAEAGYDNGTGLPELIIAISNGGDSLRIAETMKLTWEEHLDITVTIKSYAYPDYYAELKKGNYTLGTITWIGDFPDPLTFLQMWTSESNLNDARFKSDEYDSIIRQSMGEKGKQRYESLSKAEELILTTAVVLPIRHSPAFNLIDLDDIDGWYPNPLDIHPYKYLTFVEYTVPPGVILYTPPR